MNQLRVLHLGKYYPPVKGGIETVVETLCESEAAWAHSSALVLNTAFSTTIERHNGVEVRRVASVVRVGAVSLAPALPLWLARARADVLVLHEPNPMALLAYYVARPRIPLVVWYHSEVIRPQWQYRLAYEPLFEFALRRASRIVVASPAMQEVPALSRHRDKCRVIPYGLRVERYSASDGAATKVDARGKATAKPTILFVGRLVGYKGVDVLLRALPGLDADTVIVGDGPLRASLESMARELGVAGRVRFLGEVDNGELLARYRACDIFVLPSVTRQETFGMVQLEAMLFGRPVVSTDLGTGVPWVNQHERTGLVVKPGDVSELRQALTRLIGDVDLRQRLGAAAQARVSSDFTAERMCRATHTLYQEICNTGSLATTEVERAAAV
jgi:rhamnosyl/mannosyltransferase